MCVCVCACVCACVCVCTVIVTVISCCIHSLSLQLVANTTSLATKVSVYTSSFSVGTKSSNYTLVVNAATGALVSLTFVGYDRLFGSHYDKYVITYSDFSTDPPEPSTFDVPNGKTALMDL